MLNALDLEQELTNELNIRQSKVQTMFEMQNELNTLINPDWWSRENQEMGWDFQRAAMIELAELMDHYGYKWWKRQIPDMEQSKLEVIDIAHFYISYLIQKSMQESKNPYFYVESFSNELITLKLEKTPRNIRASIDYMIESAAGKNFDIEDFNLLLNLFDIEADELCATYILKNALNIFRARNGYRTGTYVKTWGGREDNEVLMDISRGLDTKSETYAKDLYAKLTEEYSKYN